MPGAYQQVVRFGFADTPSKGKREMRERFWAKVLLRLIDGLCGGFSVNK